MRKKKLFVVDVFSPHKERKKEKVNIALYVFFLHQTFVLYLSQSVIALPQLNKLLQKDFLDKRKQNCNCKIRLTFCVKNIVTKSKMRYFNKYHKNINAKLEAVNVILF